VNNETRVSTTAVPFHIPMGGTPVVINVITFENLLVIEGSIYTPEPVFNG
jgi:hypothetical protein